MTVARSSKGLLVSAGEDSLFIGFLALCIFIVLVVNVVGSVLWMVLTLSTEPFVVEDQHDGLEGDKVPKQSDNTGRQKTMSLNRGKLSPRKHSISKGNKKGPEEQSTQSAPQLSNLSEVGKSKKSEKSMSIDSREEDSIQVNSPPSSPFMKISPFNINESTTVDAEDSSRSTGKMSGNEALSSSPSSSAPAGTPMMDKTALIIDIGSTFVRFGFAGESKPMLMMRSSDAIDDINRRKRDEGKVASTIYSADGGIASAAHYVEIIKYAYSLLMTSGVNSATGEKTGTKGLKSVDATKHPLLICWPVSIPIEDAVEVTSGLFDALKVPMIHYAPAPVLALYASGRQTGCSVLSGHLHTTTVCVIDGLALEGTLVSSSLAGNYVSENLSKKLGTGKCTGAPLTGSPLQELKEKSILCSKSRQQALPPTAKNGALVLEDNDENDSENENIEGVDSSTVDDGDGEQLSMEERKHCAEGLFRRKGSFLLPETTSMEPLQNAVMTSIATAQEKYEIGDGWWGNIALSGGNAKIRNLRERLENELKANVQLSRKETIRISSTPGDSANAVWLGGSVLAKLDGFGQDHWISTESFAENRKESLSTKCQFLVKNNKS